jgi:hypothetical protein
MSKEQITGVNADEAEETEPYVGNILTDWEVDTAGNAYSVGDKSQAGLADLKDEFKENNKF